jgi:hypothetical protein
MDVVGVAAVKKPTVTNVRIRTERIRFIESSLNDVIPVYNRIISEEN